MGPTLSCAGVAKRHGAENSPLKKSALVRRTARMASDSASILGRLQRTPDSRSISAGRPSAHCLPPQPSSLRSIGETMKTQPSQTLQIMQRFNRAFVQHDASLLEDLIAEDCVMES